MAYISPSITASGTTFAQFQAGGAAGHLARLIAAQAATAAPTVAATAAAGGTGGTLPAATYYVVVTETNGIGETTAGPASAGTAVALGQGLTVTYQALKSGNVARNLYVGTSSTGPFTLAASGQTAATTVITAPLPSNSYAVAPPQANSTGLEFVDSSGNTINTTLQYLNFYRRTGALEKVWADAVQLVGQLNRGNPIPLGASITKLRHAHTTFAALAQLFAEMGTLIDANPGRLTTAQTGIGGSQAVRAWP